MTFKSIAFFIFLALVIVGVFFYMSMSKGIMPDYVIKNKNQVPPLFVKAVNQLQRLEAAIKDRAKRQIEEIIDIPSDQRTFENTAKAFDKAANFNFAVPSNTITVLSMVSSDDALRNAANAAQVSLSEFAIDTFGQNIQLYHAFKEYVDGNAKKEHLTPEQEKFLKDTMKGFKHLGLHLPLEQRKKVTELLKKLAQLSVTFQMNINTDDRSIEVTKEELAGLDDDFIENLSKTDDGKYILKTDYPTYFQVLKHAKNPQTRARLYNEFENRAYPQNIDVLNEIIALRDELAQLLGFESYAAFNLDDEMVETPAKAYEFINSLVPKAQKKASQEFEMLTKELPDSVELKDGKVEPFDIAFLQTWYKNKHFNLDDREIAKYFPMEKTVEGLLNIYETFFDIELKETPISGLWDKDVKLVEVYKKGQKEPRGYLLLDLYPRPNKYTHACEITVIPALQTKDEYVPCLAVVLANFPKSTKTKPSLLELTNVRTFFHEFGHAIHSLLGATSLAGFSGTSVKTDFVEMPSQMLEEWLWDPEMLKKVSGHYQTAKPLPDDMIKNIIDLKNFAIGIWILNQAKYALMSLDYYAPGSKKDIIKIMQNLAARLLPQIAADPENHMPASFGHITGYGARYYGYLWSQVFALDLFEFIKKYGLLNPDIGQVYAAKILQPGGSKDPNDLLKDFLGREPNEKAFFKSRGL